LEVALFLVLAGVTVLAALGVVLLRNVFRAGLALLLCFFAVAGVYALLGADFLAAVQVLIYVGAIGVFLLLALMLTREAPRGSPEGRLVAPARPPSMPPRRWPCYWILLISSWATEAGIGK